MKKAFLAATLGLACVTGVHAADWKYVTSGVDGSKKYVDVSSIRSNGQIRVVWEKLVKKDNSYNKSRMEYNCATRVSRFTSFITYDKSGIAINSDYDIDPWRHIIPDTIRETTADLVCAK
jgi:hypothetical protein